MKRWESFPCRLKRKTVSQIISRVQKLIFLSGLSSWWLESRMSTLTDNFRHIEWEGLPFFYIENKARAFLRCLRFNLDRFASHEHRISCAICADVRNWDVYFYIAKFRWWASVVNEINYFLPPADARQWSEARNINKCDLVKATNSQRRQRRRKHEPQSVNVCKWLWQ